MPEHFYYLQIRYYDLEIGRFINADDISYLDTETINGLNLYVYCGNNPVIMVDPSGHLFFSFLITSIIIGAVAGGILNGYSAYKEGARGWGLVGSIAAGAVMGGAMSAVMAIGGAAGLASVGVSVAGFGLGTAAALGISLGIGVGADLLSYSLENGLRNDKEWTMSGFLGAGVLGGLQAGATFGLAFVGGRAGLFTNKLTTMSGDQFLQHLVDTIGKVTWSQATVYATQFVFSSTVAKLLFSTLPAGIARKLIEKIIRG